MDPLLFLDEIGELSMDLQAKLLRVLEDGQFERLGSPKTISVNVRVIAATHRDLAEKVKDGTFRQDLYYRLNVFPIHLPPLRERPEDIPSLVWRFVNEFEKQMGKKVDTVPKKIMDLLQGYSWPGNIRELRNVIEQAMILTSGGRLTLDLPSTGASTPSPTLKEAERQHIVAALTKANWRIKGAGGAAQELGMNSSTAILRHGAAGHTHQAEKSEWRRVGSIYRPFRSRSAIPVLASPSANSFPYKDFPDFVVIFTLWQESCPYQLITRISGMSLGNAWGSLTMIISLVELVPSSANRVAMLEVLRLAQRGARTKNACLACDIYETVDANRTILYLERWRSLEDLYGHIQSCIYLRVLNAMDLAAEEPTVSIHEVSNTRSMDLIKALRTYE